MTVKPALSLYLSEASRQLSLVDQAVLERAVQVLIEVHLAGGIVFTAGNGGSASTASHFTADLCKYVGGEAGAGLRSICLNDNIPLTTAWTNDSGFADVYTGQLDGWVSERDALVVFSVHGGSRPTDSTVVSANLPAACALAKDRGARVIAFTGFDGGHAADLADVHVNVPCDTEPIATPLIESVHVLLHHAVCAALRAAGVHRTRQPL